MSTLLDTDPSYAASLDQANDEASRSPELPSQARRRPPGHLKLTRSLSKSDSDLLGSPYCEEDGPLGGRSESLASCQAQGKPMERLPSFTSEWDEVRAGGG